MVDGVMLRTIVPCSLCEHIKGKVYSNESQIYQGNGYDDIVVSWVYSVLCCLSC